MYNILLLLLSNTISTFPLKQWGTAHRGTNMIQKLNNPPLLNLN